MNEIIDKYIKEERIRKKRKNPIDNGFCKII